MRQLTISTILVAIALGCASARETRFAPNRAQASSSYVDSLQAKIGAGTSLTLDPRLQAAAESALQPIGRASALVAFEPETGVVRALFSVAGERGDPLLVAHIPASAFKPFAAIAGLEAGALTATTEKECTGTFQFAGTLLRCSAAHGRETIVQAISRSCNSFFYSMATEIDHQRVLDVARRFGFGSRTGIELPDEPGVVPNQARYEEVKRDPSSTVPLLDAIGHGEIKVTLLQLARAYAALANGGKLVRLGLTGSREVERTIEIRPEDLELVRAALVDVVAKEDGTAHAFAIPGFPFAGKTGSGEAPPRKGFDTEEEDAWFVAYAPPTNPKILVAARVERGDVTRDAKLAVKKVLEAWRATIK